MAQEFTPWQRTKALEYQFRKLETNLAEKARKCVKDAGDSNVCELEPLECNDCKRPITYYNNGKCNCCCKRLYDYNYFFCEGYDQFRHRDDRKHPFWLMNIDLEEMFPCREVTLLTNSNYGHRPVIDDFKRRPKVNSIAKFRRANGTKYCINANGYQAVNIQPTMSFKWNAQFGYTYSPPKN